MRIIFMTEGWYPTVGGVVWAIDNVARVLKNRGHSVSIIAESADRHSPSEESLNGIAVRRVWYLMPTTAISPTPVAVLRFFAYLFGSPLVFLATMFRLARIVRSERPQIVNVHYLGRNAFYAVILRRLLSFKLVLNVCGYDLDRYAGSSRIVKFYIRAVLRNADLVLSYTEDQLRNAESISSGVRLKSAAVGQGVDLQEFNDSTPYVHTSPYILAISNFLYRKGVDLLLTAFAHVRRDHMDLDLILVGEGEERIRLEALARQLGISDNVVFFGRTNRSDVGSLLKGCEFLVLPSRSESFGMVLIEAMLVGKTAVATRVGGIPEVLGDGERGLLVDPESAESLARGILRLLDDSQLRTRLSNEVAQWVSQEYPWPAVAERYLKGYERALEGGT